MRELAVGTPDEPYREPYWQEHPTQSSPNVPARIAASLIRSKKAGYPWELAWAKASRVTWVHDRSDRHQWVELLADQQFIDDVWRSAYEGRPCPRGGDMSALHYAIEQRGGDDPSRIAPARIAGAGRWAA